MSSAKGIDPRLAAERLKIRRCNPVYFLLLAVLSCQSALLVWLRKTASAVPPELKAPPPHEVFATHEDASSSPPRDPSTLPPRALATTDDDEAHQTVESQAALKSQPLAPAAEATSASHCLQRTQGYWTYEVCMRSSVTQFHSVLKGLARRNVARMGQYESTTADGIQRYLRGEACGTASEQNRLRETSVRAGCGRHDRIMAVREPSPCRYEVDVELRQLCGKAT